jgi:hypothetical protein
VDMSEVVSEASLCSRKPEGFAIRREAAAKRPTIKNLVIFTKSVLESAAVASLGNFAMLSTHCPVIVPGDLRVTETITWRQVL